jgi:hypothetical protein
MKSYLEVALREGGGSGRRRYQAPVGWDRQLLRLLTLPLAADEVAKVGFREGNKVSTVKIKQL